MSSQIVERVSQEKTGFSNSVIRWLDYRLPIFIFFYHELNAYPTPRNLNYLWNFGSLAGMALIIMIATGIVLAHLAYLEPDWSGILFGPLLRGSACSRRHRTPASPPDKHK